MSKSRKIGHNPKFSGSKMDVGLKRSPDPGLRKDRIAQFIGGDDLHRPLSAHDVAGYIHDMAIELKGLAKSVKLSFLVYLLELVAEESAVQKRGRL